MPRWCHEQLAREVLLPPVPGLYYMISPSLILSLLVLHMPLSVCGDTILQTSYIQFVFIQIGILQIMDYGSVTKTTLELAEKSTIWESTIKIPIADNQNSLLDISSAARGE